MAGELFDFMNMGDDATPEKQAALAQAIRARMAQNQVGADASSVFGGLGMLTGDKQLGGFGQAQLREADNLRTQGAQLEQQASQMPGERLRNAMTQMQGAKLKQDVAESGAPASPIYGALARKFGFELSPGMTNEQARKALELAEKGYSADMRAKELALNREAMRERTNKEKEPKPVPEQEAVKVNNQLEGLNALSELERLHGQVSASNPSSMIPVGNTPLNQYGDALAAKGGAVAAAMIPAGRETPGLIEEVKKGIPGAMTSHERATSAFGQSRQTILGNVRAQISSLKAAGYSPKQIADYEAKLAAVSGDGGGTAGATKVIDGKQYFQKPNGKWAVQE